jgi:hypothetical protein
MSIYTYTLFLLTTNTPQDKLARMKEQFEVEGMRRTVSAVLVVLENNTPHVLVLKVRREGG